MIVTHAKVELAARHNYQEQHQVSERLEFWLGERPGSALIERPMNDLTEQETVKISHQGFSLGAQAAQVQKLDLSASLDAKARLNLLILMSLYRAVTGQSMQLLTPGEVASGVGANNPVHLAISSEIPSAFTTESRAQTAGLGLLYERHERYRETEKMQFSALGVIHTADGRQIDFSAHLSMSRDYYEESSVVVRAGDAAKIDPLVINFDGKGVALSQTRFAFDIDNDGTEDQIASLRPGSGYLVLDRNGDGQVNNGSELFGPRTGQGFAELAQHDEDNNGFIDEGDSIYHQLRIWTMNEDGSSQLVALGDKKIGAIFLGHTTTPFQLKDNANQSLGEIVRSGVYVTEDGRVGSIQEINLTV